MSNKNRNYAFYMHINSKIFYHNHKRGHYTIVDMWKNDYFPLFLIFDIGYPKIISKSTFL
jgi:hypothetical protein